MQKKYTGIINTKSREYMAAISACGLCFVYPEARQALKAVSVRLNEFILQEIPDGIYIFYLI